MELIRIELFDVVQMKKPHPCKTKAHEFQVIKLGADLKIQCLGCGNILQIDRIKFNQKYKKTISKHTEPIFNK